MKTKITLALAIAVSIVCAAMAAAAAAGRAVTTADQLILTAAAVALALGSHLIPALAPRNVLAYVLFGGCIAATIYNHAHYFSGSSHRAGTVRAYEVLARQCAKDRAAYIEKQPKACKPITKTARGDEFASGWVHGVQALVDRFASSDRNEALIEQYMAHKYPNMEGRKTKDRTKGRNVSHNDTFHGIQAGRNAKLDRGLKANATGSLGLTNTSV